MFVRHTFVLFLVCILLNAVGAVNVAQEAASTDPIQSLKRYLKSSSVDEIGEQSFATAPLNAKQTESAGELLWQAYREQLRESRRAEWEAKLIELDDKSMKFEYRVFGEKPKGGRSLYISMHGGGGAPARVNEQQWRNQIRLYEPKEGIYLAPRAPTDTWNLWHQNHIDPMFTRIIEDAIALEDVDPNRVYLMGYSAGGDGVYQLAPRMADQIAAAAMMAGHPNDAQPLGLRNIGFTLHMGGKDSAYKRNEIARQWKKKLADLKETDPQGYEHEVVIHEKYGHWMQRDDAVAVPWMSKFTRNPFPNKVVWLQSGVTHDRFYWLAVDKANQKKGTHVVARREGQVVTIDKADGIESLLVRFNHSMIDFSKPVVIKFKDQTLYEGKLQPTIGVMVKTMVDRGDPDSLYSAEVEVKIPSQ